jgi:hypothetical protein
MVKKKVGCQAVCPSRLSKSSDRSGHRLLDDVTDIAAPKWEAWEQNDDIRILSQKARNAPGKLPAASQKEPPDMTQQDSPNFVAQTME